MQRLMNEKQSTMQPNQSCCLISFCLFPLGAVEMAPSARFFVVEILSSAHFGTQNGCSFHIQMKLS